ncbi:DUF2062 domain-containing protein [Cochlodiniinecator piscidefendens]|uniref:DUF2062 domain-containing protein n=1 Tax=Cochlodiniinecator piscidefendens TaxID=2715756 RepID=UPI002F3F4264
MVVDFLYPRGGWARAYQYAKHRMQRLPDPPHRIARGIFAGVLTSFTPLFGLHFFVAAFLARVMQGNIMASLLATFFGNPVTFPIIATTSLQLGHWMLGNTYEGGEPRGLVDVFKGAARELFDNFFAIFTDAHADWSNLIDFYKEVFLPYLVGGLVPGVVCALICYYVSAPLLTAYQNRRKGRLKSKFEEIRRKKSANKADESSSDK